MNNLTKLCIIAMFTFFPLFGTSAQENYISQENTKIYAYGQELDYNTLIEYSSTLEQNIDKIIAQNEWKKIGSTSIYHRISISTMNGPIDTFHNHKIVIIYIKLDSNSPYFLAPLRESMPDLQYMIDMFCYDITDKSSLDIARAYIDKSNQILSISPFPNDYMHKNSKISKATYKWLCKKYSLPTK